MSVKSTFNAMRLGDALNAHGVGGETYLTRAVRMGLADAAHEFIKLGADPNRENAGGELPVYIALEQKDLKMIETLVQHGADIMKKKNGLTLREHAVKAGLKDIALYAARVEREYEARFWAMASMPPC